MVSMNENYLIYHQHNLLFNFYMIILAFMTLLDFFLFDESSNKKKSCTHYCHFIPYFYIEFFFKDIYIAIF